MNFKSKIKFQLSQLENIVSDYEKFSRVAENVNCSPTEEQHYDYTTEYPLGLNIGIYKFPEAYIESHLVDAYAATVLSDIAYFEGWNESFFDFTNIQRRQSLIKAKHLYKTYAIIPIIRFCERNWQYLEKEIEFFAGKKGLENLSTQQYEALYSFQNAFIIELGGCYAGDYSYIAIKEDGIANIECGIWD